MKSPIASRLVAVALLSLLVLVPLHFISETISERSERREEVHREIMRTDVDEQVVMGPILAVPYRVLAPALPDAGAPRATRAQGVVYVLPTTLDIDGRVDPDIRRRSLFEVMTYNGHLQLTGAFAAPAAPVELKPGEGLRWEAPQLLVGLSDNRGLRTAPQLKWMSQVVALQPGQALPALGNGLHADLPLLPGDGSALAFDLALDFRGNTHLSWVPLADTTHVHLTSLWPHPSFVGAGLPQSRQISSKGFEAEWNSSALATNIHANFESAVTAGDAGVSALLELAQGVRLVQPVDAYLQTERSVKYGFLFVLLTFGAFTLFELLKALRIHPIQYSLVGIAQALFFLLLLALSEHLAFGVAYAIAAGACVALLAFYLSFVLQTSLRGVSFATLLGVLYGSMYVLLTAEDFALLLGALLLFALLAGVMLLTRRVNWYELGGGKADVPARAA